ncbi:hypothetical protein ES707_18045 [subsurface metagenome]
MAEKEQQIRCPECEKVFKIPIETTSSAAEIAQVLGQEREQIEIILQKYASQLPKTEDHRHKTSDEFLDCPECRLWFDKTATQYQVIKKEPPPAPPPKVEKKEPVAAEPAIGSVFSPEKEVKHE